MAKHQNEKVVIKNRKARYEYHIINSIEAGIMLQGTEVKSLRNGKANLQDSYAALKEGEVFLYNLHISPYEQGTYNNHEPRRPRKLLLHKSEIRKLSRQVQEKGVTLIPLKVYFKNGLAKIELGFARGKKLYDKRKVIAERDSKRQLDRELSEKNRR